MSFREINPQYHKFRLSVKFLKVYKQKTLSQQYHSLISLRPLTPYTHTQREIRANASCLWTPQRNHHSHNDAIKKQVSKKPFFLDGDTDYFDIVAGVLKENTLAPYLFIICLDYVLRTSIDLIKENGFKLAKERSRRYTTQTITDTDYAKDMALLANMITQAETLQHCLK